jgi:hypothetical protein
MLGFLLIALKEIDEDELVFNFLLVQTAEHRCSGRGA